MAGFGNASHGHISSSSGQHGSDARIVLVVRRQFRKARDAKNFKNDLSDEASLIGALLWKMATSENLPDVAWIDLRYPADESRRADGRS